MIIMTHSNLKHLGKRLVVPPHSVIQIIELPHHFRLKTIPVPINKNLKYQIYQIFLYLERIIFVFNKKGELYEQHDVLNQEH